MGKEGIMTREGGLCRFSLSEPARPGLSKFPYDVGLCGSDNNGFPVLLAGDRIRFKSLTKDYVSRFGERARLCI